MQRRDFMRTGITASAGAIALGAGFWRTALAGPGFTAGASPYGSLRPPDINGIRLPPGFTSREVARAGELPGVAALTPWHTRPDGGACFATPGGGWIYVSNSEEEEGGGVGALRFGPDGTVLLGYSICEDTRNNCAGGATPSGTWLTCEEVDRGLVYECDPLGLLPPTARPGLGSFKHEAAAVDDQTGYIYLTEDVGDGRFYRFRPDVAAPLPILASGTLEVARVHSNGSVSWLNVPTPNPTSAQTPTRHQQPASTSFARGEGAWFDSAARTVYFCTTADTTIWAHDVTANTIEALFVGATVPNSPLNGADNITVASSGDLYVCEDHGPSGGPLQMVMLSMPERVVSRFLELDGQSDSELTGVAFNPAGDRMYFSSQEGFGDGVTYEIQGPFRT